MQHVREHYIHNEVLNVDMCFRFNVHVLASAFAEPVTDLRSYMQVNHDVASGLVTPFAVASGWAVDVDAALDGDSAVRHAFAVSSAPWTSPSRNVFVQVGALVDAGATLYPGTTHGGCALSQFV